MGKNIKFLKIGMPYLICFGYIWLKKVLQSNIIQNYDLLSYILNNIIQLLFYMSIIILSNSIAYDKRNQLFDITLLLIPAIIFCASPFIVTLPNLYIYDNTLGDVLRNLMQYSGTYSFVGASILCGLLFRYRERIKSDNN